MKRISRLFTSNWISKLVSLLIAIGVWFTIFSHLNKMPPSVPPVPGTQIPIPKPPSESKPTNPLMTPPSAIPGN